MSVVLRMAIAKGRLFDGAVERLAAAGITVRGDAGRKLLIDTSEPGLQILVVKPYDVPVYVESGAADLGITGGDVLREAEADVLEPLDLGFGACRLVVAAPEATAYPNLAHGSTPRVASKYPRLARAHFAVMGRAVEVIEISGSVEVAPLLGLSDWIVDLVDTGNTLRANGLTERATILESRAILVANRASQKLKLDAHLSLMARIDDRSSIIDHR